MKVGLFIFFPPTLWTPGGGEKQVLNTFEELKLLGVDVSLFDIWSPRRDFDIIHVFGSAYQLSDFVVCAKKIGIKIVLSSIHSTNKPNWIWSVTKWVDSLVPLPTVYTYRRRIFDTADVILPSSEVEACLIQKHFSVPREKIIVVPHGAETMFSSATADLFYEKYKIKDFVFQCSRITNHKGQIRLMRAMDGLGIPLVFAGEKSMDDPEYFQRFISECNKRPWVTYVGKLSGEELASAYAAAKVHALPSLSENSALANLEAGLAGANIVTSKLPTIYEYLQDYAYYCNPTSISSIRNAVLRAYNAPRSTALKQRILSNYTWSISAQKTLAAYKRLLAG